MNIELNPKNLTRDAAEKALYSSSKVSLITDRSQQNLHRL